MQGNLDRFGYEGALHLVSRSSDEIQGRPCVKSIDALPEGIDLGDWHDYAAKKPEEFTDPARASMAKHVEAMVDFMDAGAAYGLQQQAIEKVGTQYVLKPSNFFGSDEWRGPFPTPAKSETAMDRLKRLTDQPSDPRVIEHEPDFGRFISNG